MGVDFLICDHCRDTFPDCGAYVNCPGCSRKERLSRNWCKEECAEEDGYDGETCQYCRKEKVDEYLLFEYALERLKMTREQLTRAYLVKERNRRGK